MRHLFWFLCFQLAFATSLLPADEDKAQNRLFDVDVPKNLVPEPAPTSLVNMTAMPSSVINSTVNAISGDFFVSDANHIVSGPDPYALGHTYSSSHLEEGTLGAGWNFYHHHYLQVYQPEGINFARAMDPSFDSSESSCFPSDSSDNDLPPFSSEVMPERQSTPLSASSATSCFTSRASDEDSAQGSSEADNPFHFKPNYEKLIEKGPRKNDGGYKVHGKPPNLEKNPYTFLYLQEPSGGRLLFKGNGWAKNFHLVKKNTGFTNVSSGDISGQTNIKNISVMWYAESDHWHITFGDGTRRVYGRMHKPRHKRTGYRKFCYDYHLIREVRPSRNTLLFTYNHNDELTEIKTVSHDHKHTHNWIRFRQKSDADFEKKPCLHIETSDKQNFTFRYKKLKKHTHAVSRIERPGLTALNFGYSANSSSHKKVVKSSTDAGHFIRTAYYKNGRHKGRVKLQSAPVGEHGKEIVTHRYSYHFRKKGEKTHYATVVDAYGTITRYHWNRFKRLVKIIKYSPDWKHLMSEEFVWGDKRHTGHLKVRTLFDENDTPLLSRRFVYDVRGNVSKEVLYGRFTENSGSIKLDQNGYPNKSTCDKIVTKRVYSKEGYNLKLEEIDCVGNHTYYSYFPYSNRLKSKLVCDQKEIKKREFFSYNSSACVTQHIVDDGSTEERDNLKGVTQRRITKIRPRLKCPHFGEPRIVEEYYWDFDQKKEQLLTKILNVYTKNGNISQTRISDADGNHHSTTRYDHDHVGRITYSKDAVGREQFFKYDHFGRLIEKRGPRSDVTTYYDYDRCGRLIKEAELQQGGFTYVTQYRYDLLGRKTAVIDPQGHETHISYDRLNRITKIAYPNIYDHDGSVVSPIRTFEYEKLGTKVVQKDENAYTTTTIFNAVGKIISQERPDKTIIKNFYDIKGNCIKEIAPNGVEQRITYDAFDRPTSIVMNENDKELSRKSMEYNAFHLTSEISPTGEKCFYSYDFAGRKKAMHLQGATNQNHRITTYGYDSMGRLQREGSHGVVK
ncbi:MAG: RHS repeat protein, partial [Verrucomicrobia bacterium]|nr:RHS repeat protein [Verrucomicrobiota bacterium]